MNIHSLAFLSIFTSTCSMACGGSFFDPNQATTHPQNSQCPHHRTASGHMKEDIPSTPGTPVGIEVATSTVRTTEAAAQIVATAKALSQAEEAPLQAERQAQKSLSEIAATNQSK